MDIIIVGADAVSKRAKRKIEPYLTRDDAVWPVKVEEGYAKRKRRWPLLDVPRWGAMVVTGATRADWEAIRKFALTVGNKTGMDFSTLWHEEWDAIECVRKW